ncbi:conserved oligomeric Golgi complex subunit 7-like isoform X2, partial [Leptotrombidium deliense]
LYSQDFKAFSNENFDVLNWINECFRTEHSAIANRESHASNVVYKLQLFVQEINCSLEETAQQVMHNLSKTTREVETLQAEADFLKSEIFRIKEDVTRVQQTSNNAIEQLVNVEKVKNRMQDSCKALREADNWSTLLSDVELIFNSGDLQQISSKLIDMQNSLDLLVDVPDYSERVNKLDNLKNRFESLVTEQVKLCFINCAVDAGNTFVTSFKKLKRMSSLLQIYSETLKDHMLAEWGKIVVIDSEEPIEVLNSFYDILLSNWHSHSTFCANVIFNGDYNAAFNILTNILIEVFRTCGDSMCNCIHKELEIRRNSGKLKYCLDLLIEVKQVTDRLSKSLEANIVSESKEFVKKPQLEILLSSMYSAYRYVLEIYPEIEEAILEQECRKIVGDTELGESVSKIFAVARETEKRCYLLTHSTAVSNILNILQNFFNAYLDHFKHRLKEIEKKCTNNEFTSLPNWSLFQSALFHLQSAGDFMFQLTLFEEQLRNTCEELSGKMKCDFNIFQRLHDLLLDASAKSSLNDLLLHIKRKQGNSTLILHSTYMNCQTLCREATDVVLKAAVHYVNIHLNEIKFTEYDGDDEVPLFTYSPQEHITQIGQYLLTIPQHIEPFTLQENSPFKLALSFTAQNSDTSIDNVTEFLLKAIIQKVVDSLISVIIDQKLNDDHHKQQLIIDIEYISEVFDDLGFGPDAKLQNIMDNLKA